MEAAVCASCPEAFHDEVAALCRQHGIQKAFGKAGDMVNSLSGKDWIPKWEAKVVMATVTKAQTMGAEKALIICIAGGKNCDSEMARQPHLVRAIKKEMEDEQFRVRVEWIEKEEFFERYSAAKGNAHDKKAADKSAASPEAKAKAKEEAEQAKTEAVVTATAEATAKEKEEAEEKEEAKAEEEADEVETEAENTKPAEEEAKAKVKEEVEEAEIDAEKAKSVIGKEEADEVETEAVDAEPAEADGKEKAETQAKDKDKEEEAEVDAEDAEPEAKANDMEEAEAKTEAEVTDMAEAEAKKKAEAKDKGEAEEAETNAGDTEPAEAEAEEKDKEQTDVEDDANGNQIAEPDAKSKEQAAVVRATITANAKAKEHKEHKAAEETEAEAEVEKSANGAKEKASAKATPAVQNGRAVGDPHLQNIHGQRFDLMRPGKHLLLTIPKGKPNWFLRVEAQVRRMGAQCSDMYFQEINITGKWVDSGTKTRGGIFLQAQGGKDNKRKPGSVTSLKGWKKFGPVELKVANGHTEQGIQYLNFYVKHLGRVGFVIGGLLGEDDHTAAATPVQSCQKVLSISKKLASQRHKASVPSVAEARLE